MEQLCSGRFRESFRIPKTSPQRGQPPTTLENQRIIVIKQEQPPAKQIARGCSSFLLFPEERFSIHKSWVKDKEILMTISDPAFNVETITNKALQQKLVGTEWANNATDKKLSSKISRNISLLRSHGIIRKLPKQHKYVLTDKGRRITSALDAILSASTEDLVNSVA